VLPARSVNSVDGLQESWTCEPKSHLDELGFNPTPTYLSTGSPGRFLALPHQLPSCDNRPSESSLSTRHPLLSPRLIPLADVFWIKPSCFTTSSDLFVPITTCHHPVSCLSLSLAPIALKGIPLIRPRDITVAYRVANTAAISQLASRLSMPNRGMIHTGL